MKPPIDSLPQIPVNSVIMQKMMDKQIQPDTFKLPLHNLSLDVQWFLEKLLKSFKYQFMKDENSIAMTNLTKMHINTGNSKPVLQKPYPIAMKHRVKNEINKLLDTKVICSSHSNWSGPIIIIPKGNKRKCLVIDYRTLNKVTRKFICPMPKVKDIFSKLNGQQYFSTLDLQTGYHHTPLNDTLIPKTAFTLSL